MTVELHLGKPEVCGSNMYFWLVKNDYGNIILYSQREGKPEHQELVIYTDLTIDPTINAPHNCKVSK